MKEDEAAFWAARDNEASEALTRLGEALADALNGSRNCRDLMKEAP